MAAIVSSSNMMISLQLLVSYNYTGCFSNPIPLPFLFIRVKEYFSFLQPKFQEFALATVAAEGTH